MNNNFDNHDNEVPQEGWDEEIIKKNNTVKYKIFGLLKGLIALFIMLGLLYFSGIYQGTFFRTTPPQVQPRQLPVLVEGETMNLPLRVVKIVDLNNKNYKSETEITDLVNKASQIWDQARIDLELVDYLVLEKEEDEIREILLNPVELLNQTPEEKENEVTVFLVHSLRGINGIAFVGRDIIALAEFTSVYNFRVLAHEVGHILGLPHIKERGRLMTKDASGSRLTVEEALRAREVLNSLVK